MYDKSDTRRTIGAAAVVAAVAASASAAAAAYCMLVHLRNLQNNDIVPKSSNTNGM